MKVKDALDHHLQPEVQVRRGFVNRRRNRVMAGLACLALAGSGALPALERLGKGRFVASFIGLAGLVPFTAEFQREHEGLRDWDLACEMQLGNRSGDFRLHYGGFSVVEQVKARLEAVQSLKRYSDVTFKGAGKEGESLQQMWAKRVRWCHMGSKIRRVEMIYLRGLLEMEADDEVPSFADAVEKVTRDSTWRSLGTKRLEERMWPELSARWS
jgi:hypothetical protein